MDEIIVGIDVGTTKICTLVGRVEEEGQIRILGLGIEPSAGMKKGVVVDLDAASAAIRRSVEKAQQTSGLEIAAALVSLAGGNVSSVNSRGSVAVPHGVIEAQDMARALDQAQAIAIPHDREIVHIIQRDFIVDGQSGIRSPLGMHGYRLEVEAHIITASAATLENLRQCVRAAGVETVQFVLNPLASGEVVLTEQERQLGAAICDIGGGTTDLAIYVDGNVWHTMVLAVGGNHITQDIAHGLRLPFAQAEEVKIQRGHAWRQVISTEEYFTIRPFGEDQDVRISRQELAYIIQARVEEMFFLILQEIKRSGFDGLLPAGLVLTGGSSALPGIRQLAAEVLGMPVRIAKPENLLGMADRLSSPAYSTSVGLLQWAVSMRAQELSRRAFRPSRKGNFNFWAWLKRLLP
ncbi:MAG: cell division protein FtsA [Anaerolineales bacterium]